MASQTIFTLPLALQSVGIIAPFTSQKINPQGWRLQVSNAADWPTNGQPALRLLIEQASPDAEFVKDFEITLNGLPWAQGVTSTNINVGGGRNDRILTARLTITMLQACSFGVTWIAL